MYPESPTVSDFVLISLIAGTAGAIAMYFTMRLINISGWAKGDMLLALGSMALNRRENAFLVGTVIHWVSSIVFAFLYLLVLSKTGCLHFPAALFGGAFLGGLQGFFVSLALVWVATDRHPLEEFRNADLPIGVMHLVGHIAFGATVGFIIGLWTLRQG